MGYVLAGYGITLVSLAAYAARVLRRRQAVARTLVREGRPWP